MAGNPYKNIIKMITNSEKAKTVGEQFVADLERSVQLSKENTMPSKTVKPSSLGGCLREQWLMLQGASQDVGLLEKAVDIGIQQSGNDRHNRLQNACQNASRFRIPIIWLDPADEVALAQQHGINTIIKRRDGNELLCFNSDYCMNFKCDGIIMYREQKYILEIKTEEYMKFNCRIGPEPKHEYQAVAYSLCFGIDKVLFLYEDRNLLAKKSYEVIVTEDKKQEVKERIKQILLYNDLKITPPKEDAKKCTYCKYKQTCRKYGNTTSYTLEELIEKSKAVKESADNEGNEGKQEEDRK